MKRVLQKIRQDNKKFITSEEIKQYSKDFYINYRIISNYLTSRKYLIKILDNLYYVKSNDEINQNKLQYSTMELVSKGIEQLRVKTWYYGLYTALKLMNIDFENEGEFLYLINDRILKNKPTKILGKKFRFLQFKDSFFKFGIIKGKVYYSDLEKTILDLIYLWDYNHSNENKILIEVSKLLEGSSKKKILEYSQYYPKSTITILDKALKKFD